MPFADQYFSKQKGFIPCPDGLPSGQLCFIVVVPACREPHLIAALDSLNRCDKPVGHVEVIVVLNLAENANPDEYIESLKTADEIRAWMDKHSRPEFRFILTENLKMPARDAGVGLARKTGMDQALYRFNYLNNPGGFILSYDADTFCESNYFTAIEAVITNFPNTRGINVYFEHPVMGSDYPETIYKGIILYEMHLRYLNLMTRFTGFPHAYHTVGSCFGVRAESYAREGGMNRRKAGEDFYFLHKIIPLGEFREVNTTCVFPSPRESDRVPFGTGAAIRKYVASHESDLPTYAPECFFDLKAFFNLIPDLFQLSHQATADSLELFKEPLKGFLKDIGAIEGIREIRANSGSQRSFVNRFYRWFDAFRIIKFLNHATGHYPQIPIENAVLVYLKNTGIIPLPVDPSAIELLTLLRKIERSRSPKF
jgi:hypothetical protein